MIELLIVIFIIGVLISLLVPAFTGAVRRSGEAAQLAEFEIIRQEMMALDRRPPSRVILREDGDYSDDAMRLQFGLTGTLPVEIARLRDRSVRELRMIWPRMPIGKSGPTWQLTGADKRWHDWNGNGVPDSGGIVADGFECLVLFMGGIVAIVDGEPRMTGFGRSPQWPIVQAPLSARRKPLHDFNPNRLIDSDGDGLREYADSIRGTPIAYFAAYEGQYDPNDCNLPDEPARSFSTGGTPKYVASPGPNPYCYSSALPTGMPPRWANDRTFQLISAGNDGEFGPGGQWDNESSVRMSLEPDDASITASLGYVPAVGRSAENDNLANFTGSRLD